MTESNRFSRLLGSRLALWPAPAGGRRKAVSTIAVLLASSFLLTGCWDRREINDAAFVVASGIDLEPDGKYRLSVQIPLASQLGGSKGGGGGTGGNKSYYIDSDTGMTVSSAIAKLQSRMSRKLVFSHRRVIIIGEELARRGIRDLIDVMARLPENRITAEMIVAKGTASDLLKATPRLERFSGEAIREMAQSKSQISINSKKVANRLSSPGFDPLLIYMTTKKTGSDKEKSDEVNMAGYAQFRRDQMVAVFEGDSAQGLSWLMNDIGPYGFEVDFRGKPIFLRVLGGKSTVIPVLRKDGSITMKITVNARFMIQESLTYEQLTKENAYREVSALGAEQIRRQINAALRQIRENGGDSPGFGMIIWRRYPEVWTSRYEKTWRDTLKSLDTSLSVNGSVTQLGLTNENIGKEEPRR